MSKDQISMKLLIDKSKHKVLFAEAGKECVDFLFHILSLPLGSVVGFLSKESMAGSIGNLYGSLEALGNDFFQEGISKDCLLSPKSAAGSASDVPLLTIKSADAGPAAKKFYISGSCCYNYVSDGPGTSCPSCRSQMTREATYVTPPAAATTVGKSSGGGYVKGVVTYMVMDDLSVQPMSTISSITMLNKFNIQDVGCLDEKDVTLDMNMGFSLLKASLTSKTVLTDVFLPKTSGCWCQLKKWRWMKVLFVSCVRIIRLCYGGEMDSLLLPFNVGSFTNLSS